MDRRTEPPPFGRAERLRAARTDQKDESGRACEDTIARVFRDGMREEFRVTSGGFSRGATYGWLLSDKSVDAPRY